MKIEVSNGEIIDKLTILEIKKEKITDVDKLKNISNEYVLLYSCVNKLRIRYASSEFDDLYSKLLDVNRQLWSIEDDIRQKESKSEFDEEFIELARSVYVTNDLRSGLKKELNLLTESNLIEEKSYKQP